MDLLVCFCLTRTQNNAFIVFLLGLIWFVNRPSPAQRRAKARRTFFFNLITTFFSKKKNEKIWFLCWCQQHTGATAPNGAPMRSLVVSNRAFDTGFNSAVMSGRQFDTNNFGLPTPPGSLTNDCKWLHIYVCVVINKWCLFGDATDPSAQPGPAPAMGTMWWRVSTFTLSTYLMRIKCTITPPFLNCKICCIETESTLNVTNKM